MRYVSDRSFRENQTHILFLITFFLFVLFMGYVEKYGTAGQATDDNMAHAFYMLDT